MVTGVADSKAERRQHKRLQLNCPIVISDKDGEVLAKTKTLNISDGGTIVLMPLGALPTFQTQVSLEFSVARSTANTYMLEPFTCQARVARHQPVADEGLAAVAFQFHPTQQLAIEV